MTKTLTTAEYAKLIGKSVRQARRIAAVLKCAVKVRGRWEITLSSTDLRALRRKLVDTERAACAEIRKLRLGDDVSQFTAIKQRCYELLTLIGSGSLVLAMDHEKIWRGRSDRYGYNTWRSAVREVDALIAA